MTLPNKEGSREVRWINDLDYAGMSLGVIFQTDQDLSLPGQIRLSTA
jgi:hypothetical protein